MDVRFRGNVELRWRTGHGRTATLAKRCSAIAPARARFPRVPLPPRLPPRPSPSAAGSRAHARRFAECALPTRPDVAEGGVPFERTNTRHSRGSGRGRDRGRPGFRKLRRKAHSDAKRQGLSLEMNRDAAGHGPRSASHGCVRDVGTKQATLRPIVGRTTKAAQQKSLDAGQARPRATPTSVDPSDGLGDNPFQIKRVGF